MATLRPSPSPNSSLLKRSHSLRRFPALCPRNHLFFSRGLRLCSGRIRASSAEGDGDGGNESVGGGRSWMEKDSSGDSFSGWLSGGSRSRGSPSGGAIVAGAAGAIFVAGIAFASFSLSKKPVGSSKHMKPLTPLQEIALTSDSCNEASEQSDHRSAEESANKISLVPDDNTKMREDFFPSKEFEGDHSERPSNEVHGGTLCMEIHLLDDTKTVVGCKTNDVNDVKIGDVSTEEKCKDLQKLDGNMLTPCELTSSDNKAIFNADKSGDGASLIASGATEASSSLSMSFESSKIVNDSQQPISSLVFDCSVSSQYVNSAFENFEGNEHFITLLSNSSNEPSLVSSKPCLPAESPGFSDSPSLMESGMERFLQADQNSNSNRKTEMFHGEGFEDLADTGSIDGTKLSEETIAFEVPPQNGDASETDILVEPYTNNSFIFPPSPEQSFSNGGIPAPSLVPAALQVAPGKVVISPFLDQVHGQALAALQALKVIDADAQPGDLCTRREFARWLVAANNGLSRNSLSKVYPAMYIENVTELAFDDITPQDPDYRSIQGLAEAGLISSKLTKYGTSSLLEEETDSFTFSPDSPLSRQDLVSWKMAVDKRQLPSIDKETLYECSGFVDIDRIHPDAWPALAADRAAGEQGITALAFGYTRLFQPGKPVTKAQAAIALATGESAEIVGEELTRIEAESLAESAVAAHTALVASVEKELNSSFQKELIAERERIVAVKKLAEEATRELERIKAERDEERNTLVKGRAAVETEMEVFTKLRQEVEEQLQNLMSDKFEVSHEQERLNKLRREAECKNQALLNLQHELEVERKALSIARAWAEDEAKRAREHVKAIEEARERWTRQGIKVVVDNDLHEEVSGLTWVKKVEEYTVDQAPVKKTITRHEEVVEKLKALASEVKGKSLAFIESIIHKIQSIIKRMEVIAKEAAEKANAFRSKVVLTTKEKSREFSESSASLMAGLSSSVIDRAKQLSGECKEGLDKISQRFKS